jgi:hypothetical protein
VLLRAMARSRREAKSSAFMYPIATADILGLSNGRASMAARILTGSATIGFFYLGFRRFLVIRALPVRTTCSNWRMILAD